MQHEQRTNPQAGEAGAPTREFLTFGLGQEEYGIPILSVQEIIGYQAATPVPNTPPWMSGVINIRGLVIPVFDVRRKFGMAPGAYDKTSVTIVNRVGSRVMGIVVDQVHDVLALPGAAIQPTPEMSGGIDPAFITGLGRVAGRVVMLLDIQRLLEDGMEAAQAA